MRREEEEEDAHKRSTRAGSRSQREYPGEEEVAKYEYQERGAQDEPTGQGTENQRVKESTH